MRLTNFDINNIKKDRLFFLEFNATLNNISVMLCGQFYWWRKPIDPAKTSNLPQVIRLSGQFKCS